MSISAASLGYADKNKMVALDVDTFARLARIALAAGEYYAFCRSLSFLAEVAPREAEWRVGYLQSLAKLGLNTAALQVVQEVQAAMPEDRAMQGLAASLRNAPSGYIPWSSLRRAFAANLAALKCRDENTAASVEASWRIAAEQFELHKAHDGNYQVREAGPAWPPRWLPSLDDHRALAHARVYLPPGEISPPPLLFDGLGLGWEVLHACAKTKNVFLQASSTVYIIEPYPEALAIAFHLHDWRELLGDERVQWFVGDGCVDRLRALLDADPTWSLVDRVHRVGIVSKENRPSAIAAISQVDDSRMARVKSLTREIEQRYSGRDAAWWHRRFAEAIKENGQAQGRPLRILGFTSLHTTFLQYSMRDCLRALESLGHETRLMIETAPHRHLGPVTLLEAQLAFEPDVILLLSRMRYETPHMLHPSIPSLTWDQDSLPWVFDKSKRPRLAWNDFLMGFAARGTSDELGWPARQCHYCAMAGSAETYSSDPLPAEELELYRCDVSYVSHSSATVQAEFLATEKWLPEGRLRTVFRRAVERLLPEWMSGGDYPGSVMTAILDVCEQDGLGAPTYDELCKLTQPVHRVAGRAFRQVALEWVADWADHTGHTLNLWGNGWEHHPRLAKYARGAARNGEELRRIYQASIINLQLMMTGFFHQRALDGLMAGGFFLGRRSNSSDLAGPALRELVRLLDHHHITSSAGLESLTDEEARRKIVATLTSFGEDPRALSPRYIEMRRLTALDDFIDEQMPGFENLLFSSAAEFAEKAERFLADAALRAEYAATMRRILLEGYSYEARMVEMVLFLRDAFGAQVGQADPLAGEPVVPVTL